MAHGQANADIRTDGGPPALTCNHEAPIIAIQDTRGMDKAQNGKGWNDNGTAYTVDAMATQGVCHTLRGRGFDASEDVTGRGTPLVPVSFHNRQDPDVSGSITHPLGAKDNGLGVMVQASVRRLTPRECERLQGFPDDWTKIPWRGKGADDCPDGPRYKACGNSMAVPVMAWIGKRIAMVEAKRA